MVRPFVTITRSLPIATGMVRTTLPATLTVILWVRSSMVAIREAPMVKEVPASCWP